MQKVVIKTIPKKKKHKKAKRLSEEALRIAEKRREIKGKGEKDIHLNAEFRGIAKRDKKAFLSEQRKEIQENNRMGKTRDLFKKIRDTKRTFHAKMGTIKDRNDMDLTEPEDNKKRWQEYTEELYKFIKISSDQSRSDQSLSRVQLFGTPWAVAYQGPLSMGFSRQ